MRNILLTVVMALAASAANAETIKASVNGLVCSFCATGIEKTFRGQPVVKDVKVDLDSRLVTIQTVSNQSLDDTAVTKLLTDSGYTVVNIERVR